MDFESIRELESRVLIPTYERLPVLLVRGEGSVVYDDRGKRYVDFLGGLAVNSLGYNHPEIMQTLREESESLLHVSNLFYHRYQAPLAETLARLAGLERVFFCNSGTEAVEGAIKLARAFSRKRYPAAANERYELVAVENSFHGRTLGALAATWPEKYRKPFEPLAPGMRFVRLNDVEDLKRHFTVHTAAFMAETIQGEGGVVELSEEFLRTAKDLCQAHGALFIADEIQCGLGRTGRMFAFEKFGLRPDIVLVAKPLAAGLPLAAIIASDEVATALSPGLHGTTFGGGPLQCRVAMKVLEIIQRPGFLDRVRETGAYFRERLESIGRELPLIRGVRGDGLMLGVELGVPGKSAVSAMLEAGFLINCTQQTVLRFLPPLIIERKQVDEFLIALRAALLELAGRAAKTHQEVHA